MSVVTPDSALAGWRPLGERALTIAPAAADPARPWETVAALDAALAEAELPGVVEIVPALASLTLHFDPLVTDHATLWRALQAICVAPRAAAAARSIEIAVEWGGEDSAGAARTLGLEPASLYAAIEASELSVAMLGFMPGFAYIVGLPEALQALPRRSDPRTEPVPPGAVLMTSGLVSVAPCPLLTGWHVIGTSRFRPMVMGDPPAFQLAPGDRVRFRAESGRA